jgi:hypothetical protein
MKSLIYLCIFLISSITTSAQERPDTIIILKSWKQFNSVKKRLEKKHFAFSWTTGESGGSYYGKNGTGKSIEYRYEDSKIVTRKKGGEIIF